MLQSLPRPARPIQADGPSPETNLRVSSRTINSVCTLDTSAADMTFPATGLLTSTVQATSTLTVQCSSGTSYAVTLNAGMGSGATTAVRKMTGSSSNTVDYSLYQDASHSILWGLTTDGESGTGDGTAQNLTVYGLVPVQTTPPADTYSDTIHATVTY